MIALSVLKKRPDGGPISPNKLRPPSSSIIMVILVVFVSMVTQPCLGMERIKRQHSRTIYVNTGDTVKLEWTASVSSSQLVLFNCGYKDNGKLLCIFYRTKNATIKFVQ